MTGLLSSSRPVWVGPLIRWLAFAAAMGVVGYVVGRLAAMLLPDLGPLPEVRLADLAAVLLAAGLIVVAASTALVSLSPARLGKTLKLEGPAGPTEIRDTRIQAAVLLLSGVILTLPPLLMAMGVIPGVALGGILILLVVHTALNLKLYRSVDELFRRTVIECGAVTFWLGQGLLFLWAVAERLGVAPPVTAWDIYVVLMGTYLVISMAISIRRGLA